MNDNIGNEICVGDFVFCYSGQYKNTIQKVTGFRFCNGESLSGVTDAVNFGSRAWVSAVNVVSLNALGADVNCLENISRISQSDAIGNTLQIGDKVLYLHPLEMYAEVGVVKSLSAKSCLLSIKHNRFDQTEYRKKYEELISLTALGVEKLPCV